MSPGNQSAGCKRNSDMSAWRCNAGVAYALNGACKKCTAGEDKPLLGPGLCTACLSGTYSASTGAISISTCLSCSTNTWSSDHTEALVQCTCNAGYTGTGGTGCVACAAGTYKEYTGNNAECTPCGLKTYSAVTAATSIDTCTSCSLYAFTTSSGSAATSACICQGGYYDPSFVV